MPLIDLLPKEQRNALRRLRKRIRNREYMRRIRSAIDFKLLCPGVDLPLEAGTCGRWIWPQSSRCIRCHNRRMWLLKYSLNPAEAAIAALLADDALEDVADHVGNRPAHDSLLDTVPLLDDLSALGDPCLRW